MAFSGGLLRSLPSVPLILLHKSNGRPHQPGAHHGAIKKSQIFRTLTLKIPAVPKTYLKIAIPFIKFHSIKQLEVSSSSSKDSKHRNLSIRILLQKVPEKWRSGKIRRNRERLKAIGFNWYGESGQIAIRDVGDISLSLVASTKIRDVARGQRGWVHYKKRVSSFQWGVRCWRRRSCPKLGGYERRWGWAGLAGSIHSFISISSASCDSHCLVCLNAWPTCLGLKWYCMLCVCV